MFEVLIDYAVAQHALVWCRSELGSRTGEWEFVEWKFMRTSTPDEGGTYIAHFAFRNEKDAIFFKLLFG